MTTAIILGAAVWENGPSPTLQRRARHGAALFHQGRVNKIIVCGGLGKHPPTEAAAMAHILLAEGVDVGAILREDQSTTTGENIAMALPLLIEKDVILVTDWYHAPRARLVAKRAGLHARSSAPSPRGAKIWPQTKGALREIPAYIAYALYLAPGAWAKP